MIFIPVIFYFIYRECKGIVCKFFFYLADLLNSQILYDFAINILIGGYLSSTIFMAPVVLFTAVMMAKTGRTVALPRY